MHTLCIATPKDTTIMGTYILETVSGSTYVVELTPKGSFFSGMGRSFIVREDVGEQLAPAPKLGERYVFGDLISTSIVVKMTAYA